MSAALTETRGGIALPRRYTITTAGQDTPPPHGTTNYVQISNVGGQILHVYTELDAFTAADATRRLELAATTGYWAGPVELFSSVKKRPDGVANVGHLWLRAATGSTTVEIVFFQRRG